MTKKIVDQYGKPFVPDPMAGSLKKILGHCTEPREDRLKEIFTISALRQSCGVEPGTITMRRYLPFDFQNDGKPKE